MAYLLDSTGIIETAMGMETNAQAFYLAAAGVTGDENARRLFTSLAQWEGCHREEFARLQNNADSPEGALAADPGVDGEKVRRYLQTVSRDYCCLVEIQRKQWLEGPRSTGDILQLAIKIECASILVYTGMCQLAGSVAERHRIEQVIQDEIEHVAMLSGGLG